MTVKELITVLQKYNPEMEVIGETAIIDDHNSYYDIRLEYHQVEKRPYGKTTRNVLVINGYPTFNSNKSC